MADACASSIELRWASGGLGRLASIIGCAGVAAIGAPVASATVTSAALDTSSAAARAAAADIGTMTTYAGHGTLTGPSVPAARAFLYGLTGIAVDPAGNVYYSEGYSRVAKITPGGAAGKTVTTFAGKGTPGAANDPPQQGFNGDGGAAASSLMNTPAGLATDPLGNLYIADWGNLRVRKVDHLTGKIDTFAGGGPAVAGFGDGGQARNAYLGPLTAVAADRDGNVYIVGFANRWLVRKVAPSGVITTIAGQPPSPFSSRVASLATDSHDNVYVGDTNLNVIRKIDAGTGLMTVFAGQPGGGGDSGDGGPATAAQIVVEGLAVDSHDNVYTLTQTKVRKIDATTRIITTVAGTGAQGYSGDGGPATQATFFVGSGPQAGLAIDAHDNIYIADVRNHAIRRVLPAPALTLGLSGAATQHVLAQKSVTVTVHCNRACALTASGSIKITGLHRTFALKTTRASLTAVGSLKLRLAMSAVARKAFRKQFKHGRKARATITVHGGDRDGRSGAGKRTIKIA